MTRTQAELPQELAGTAYPSIIFQVSVVSRPSDTVLKPLLRDLLLLSCPFKVQCWSLDVCQPVRVFGSRWLIGERGAEGRERFSPPSADFWSVWQKNCHSLLLQGFSSVHCVCVCVSTMRSCGCSGRQGDWFGLCWPGQF